MVILASRPRTEVPVPTVEVTIPTTSPTAYPFPGFTIIGVPEIVPEVAVILKTSPEPFPVIL